MKRILFVCTGNDFPKGTMTFLKSLEEQGDTSVMGLFFSSVDFDAVNTASYIPIAAPYLRVKDRLRQEVKANKAIFARECADCHIKFYVHENEDDWDLSLFTRQTRFADLVVLCGESFYSEIDSVQPNFFLQEALHAAECPVMIVPEEYVAPQHVVIACDGSRSSIYAIKQFCFLFPQFTVLPTEIIHVSEEEVKNFPNLELLKDFAGLHFPTIGYSQLHSKAAAFFTHWVGQKENVLLVSGSFGRSPFSYVLRQSFSRKVLRDHKMPLFIAHT